MAAFAFDPRDPMIVYGGARSCRSGALLRSVDEGLTFKEVYTAAFVREGCEGGEQAIRAIEVSAADSDLVVAAGTSRPNWSDGGAVVLRSRDGADTWVEVLTLPEPSSFECLALHPTHAEIAYVGGETCAGAGGCRGVLYSTRDGGSVWTPLASFGAPVRSLAINAQRPDLVYLTTADHQLWRSGDGGAEWLSLSRPGPRGPGAADLVIVDPRVPSHVYVAGAGNFAESVDGGDTWGVLVEDLTLGLPPSPPASIAADDASDQQTLYGGYDGVWRLRRHAPQPSEPMTVTVTAERGTVPVGAKISIESLIIDEFENWVADGTQASFVTTDEGTFGGSEYTGETRRGVVRAEWTAQLRGTAVITVSAGAVAGITEVRVGGEDIYLPMLANQ
jgi:photosystem II stability/assembly factor-like uncharacterized protein